MADTLTNFIDLYVGLQAAYDARRLLEGDNGVNPDGLYIVTDSSRIYRGTDLVAQNNVRIVDALPAAAAAFSGIIYITHSAQDDTYSAYILNDAKDGYVSLFSSTASEIDVWTDGVKLSKDLTVQLGNNVSIGGLGAGETVAAGSTLTELLTKLLQKKIAPTTTQPAISITNALTKNVEAGTTVTPAIAASFNPGSYTFGPNTGVTASSYTLKRTTDGTITSVVDGAANVQSFTETDPITVPDGSESLKYQATVVHTAATAAPVYNTGGEYEAGKIAAGTKTSNTIAFNGQRKYFYGVVTAPCADSASVRALSGSALNPSAGTKFNITMPVGSTMCVFAYPANIRDVNTVLDTSVNLDVKGAFVLTSLTVEGANGYVYSNGLQYKVYTYTSAVPLEASKLLTITL